MNERNWLRTLEQRVNPQTAALIVLDMLKANPDAPPSMEIPRIKGPLRHLIQLIASGRRVSLPIIYVRNSHGDWTVLPNLRYAWMSQRSNFMTDYSLRKMKRFLSSTLTAPLRTDRWISCFGARELKLSF